MNLAKYRIGILISILGFMFETSAQTTPNFSVSPTSVSFNPEVVGTTSAGRILAVNVSGSTELRISSIRVVGSHPDDFGISTTCGAGVASNGSCTISVVFRPSVVGTRTASIQIQSNGPLRSISLRGTGQSPPTPVASVSSTSLSFTSQTVGTTSAIKTITLRNSGSGTLQVSTITLLGNNFGDFVTSNNCGVGLVKNASCTVSVAFKPSATGYRSAYVEIKSNVGTRAISLFGNGDGVASEQVLFFEDFRFGFGQQWSSNPAIAQRKVLNGITYENPAMPTTSFTPDGVGIKIKNYQMPTFSYSGIHSIATIGTGVELVARVNTLKKETSTGESIFETHLVNSADKNYNVGIFIHYGCYQSCQQVWAYVTQGGKTTMVLLGDWIWSWDSWYLLKISDVPAVGLRASIHNNEGAVIASRSLGMPLSDLGPSFRVGFGTISGYDGNKDQTAVLDWLKVCKGQCN